MRTFAPVGIAITWRWSSNRRARLRSGPRAAPWTRSRRITRSTLAAPVREPTSVGARSGRRLVAHLVIAEADPKLIEEANALARHLRGLHDALNEGGPR